VELDTSSRRLDHHQSGMGPNSRGPSTIAATYSLRFRAETQKMEQDAVKAMEDRGLRVITLDPDG
jgi:hypothetical protein